MGVVVTALPSPVLILLRAALHRVLRRLWQRCCLSVLVIVLVVVLVVMLVPVMAAVMPNAVLLQLNACLALRVRSMHALVDE